MHVCVIFWDCLPSYCFIICLFWWFFWRGGDQKLQMYRRSVSQAQLKLLRPDFWQRTVAVEDESTLSVGPIWSAPSQKVHHGAEPASLHRTKRPFDCGGSCGGCGVILEERDKYYTFSSSSRAMPSVWLMPLLDIFLPTDKPGGESAAGPSLSHVSEGKKKEAAFKMKKVGLKIEDPCCDKKKKRFYLREKKILIIN